MIEFNENWIGKKEIELLKLFENHLDLSLDEISFFLETNPISTRKYINNLNNFLNTKMLGKINNLNRKFVIEFNSIPNFSELNIRNINYDPKERFYFIVILLIFEDKITVSSLMHEMNVTMNTLLGDLNKVKVFFNTFNLTVLSTPFSGVSLVGNKNSKNNFSINFILKYLLENEFNPSTFNLFGIYVNPLLYQYFNKKIKNIDMVKIEETVHNIIEELNINSDIYFYTTLKAALIYSSIKNLKNCYVNKKSYIKEKANIYLKLIKIINPSNKLYINLNIFLLTKIIYRHTSQYSLHFMKKNILFNIFLEKIERIYKMELTLDEKNILFKMIKKFEYKYLFEIKNYDNNYITNSNIPSSILNDIRYTLKKNKLKLLQEDVFMLALYIYQIVCNYYSNIEFKKKFLICDYSINNWIGNGFSNELKRYLPFIQTDIISICSFKFKNLDFNNYDYIVFMNKFGKNNITINNDFKDKIIFINYQDHFEINNFWGHLFFRGKIDE